jgi:hypothetical protein
MFSYPCGKFKLFINLIKKDVVFFVHHTVTVRTVFGEDLKTYIREQTKERDSPKRMERELPRRTLPES